MRNPLASGNGELDSEIGKGNKNTVKSLRSMQKRAAYDVAIRDQTILGFRLERTICDLGDERRIWATDGCSAQWIDNRLQLSFWASARRSFSGILSKKSSQPIATSTALGSIINCSFCNDVGVTLMRPAKIASFQRSH